MQEPQEKSRFYPQVSKIPWKRASAMHSSILAWRIPWTEDLGRLQSTGSLYRVRQDWNGRAHTPIYLIGLLLRLPKAAIFGKIISNCDLLHKCFFLCIYFEKARDELNTKQNWLERRRTKMTPIIYKSLFLQCLDSYWKGNFPLVMLVLRKG